MNEKDSLMDFSQDDTLQMLDETSKLLAEQCISELSSAAVAVPSSEALANNVEYWNWMARNYKASGIFDSPSSMQEYITRGVGKEEWFAKQLNIYPNKNQDKSANMSVFSRVYAKWQSDKNE